MTEKWVITFPSVYHAYRAKDLLEQHQIPAVLIPIPRQLTGSCEGLAVTLAEKQVVQAVALLDLHQVQMVKRGIQVPGLL